MIVQAGGNDAIDATVTTRGWSIGDGGVRITEHQNGNRVEIDIKLPETHFSWGNKSLRVEVQVPRDLLADIHTGDGSIKLQDLAGAIRADTGDGSIEASHLDGSLDAHTGDGNVHISGRFDNLSFIPRMVPSRWTYLRARRLMPIGGCRPAMAAFRCVFPPI